MADNEAARRREGYIRALREEREGYVRAGMTDRVRGVDDELARVEGKPMGRSETETEPKRAPRSRRA